jgi:hypothetical protein
VTEDKKEPEQPQDKTPISGQDKVAAPLPEKAPEQQPSPPLSVDEKLDRVLRNQDKIDEQWSNLHTDVSTLVDKYNYIDAFIRDKVVPELNKEIEFRNLMIKEMQKPSVQAEPSQTQAEPSQVQTGTQTPEQQFEAAMQDLAAHGGNPNHPFMGIIQRLFYEGTNRAMDSVFGAKPTVGQVYQAQVFPELQRKWMEGMLAEQNTNIEVGKAIVDRVRGKLQTAAADEIVTEIAGETTKGAVKGMLTK